MADSVRIAWDQATSQERAELVTEYLQSCPTVHYRLLGGMQQQQLLNHHTALQIPIVPKQRSINALELIRKLHQFLSATQIRAGGTSRNPFLQSDEPEAEALKIQKEKVELEISQEKLQRAIRERRCAERYYIPLPEFQVKLQWMINKIRSCSKQLFQIDPRAQQVLLRTIESMEDEFREANGMPPRTIAQDVEADKAIEGHQLAKVVSNGK